MSLSLIQSPEKVPGSSTQMVLIHLSSDNFRKMPSATITKRVQWNSLIHIMLSILFCALLAMLRNFHDTVPRQEIHTTNASFHVPNSSSGKFSTLTRIFNHC